MEGRRRVGVSGRNGEKSGAGEEEHGRSAGEAMRKEKGVESGRGCRIREKRRVRERKGGGDGMKTRIGVRKGIAEVLFPLCERRRAGLSAA